MKKKPKWSKPKLIVLVKAREMEQLLANCKSSSVGGSSGQSAYCHAATPFCSAAQCNAIGTS